MRAEEIRDMSIRCLFQISQDWYRMIINSIFANFQIIHYIDVVMSAMTSQITGVSVVYSTICSGADQRKYQSSVSLVLLREIHRSPVNSPHKGPVTPKMLPFDDVIMQTNTRA